MRFFIGSNAQLANSAGLVHALKSQNHYRSFFTGEVEPAMLTTVFLWNYHHAA